jgi:spore maturation protein SpmB
MPSSLAEPAAVLWRLIRDAAGIWIDLFKIMIPILIAVKVLKELGWIVYLAKPLAPLMGLVGLPSECGLTFATALANNLYAALAVHAALVPTMPQLTVAQATVFGTMMLIAHNIFVEGAIAKKCGAGFWGQIGLRLGGAFACGAMLRAVFSWGGLMTGPAPLLFSPASVDAGLAAWALGEVKNLGLIACVITALVGLMRGLERLGVTRLFRAALLPFLRLMGIGGEAATITVIGLVMGLAYGGGLILLDVQRGKVSRRDVFAAVSLMSLSHALIEDTLLMYLIGASLWGTFVGRLVFSLAVMAVLSRLYAEK